MEYITLNDGNKIPAVGFGVFMIPADGSTYKAVLEALQAGYRHIDTAAAYFNEAEVGKAVRDSGIPREDIFITSKLWLQDYGYEAAKLGIQTSLDKLGTGYIDLYLLHQPYGDVAGAWKALEEAKAEGKLRSIGVSNMTPKLYRELTAHFACVPAVNQVECNPLFQQKALREVLSKDNVKLEAWYPLGHGDKSLLENPAITALTEKYGKNAGQIILRFEVQEGFIVLPKSTNPERIRGNIDIFDFELTEDEMDSIRALDTGKGSHDPEAPGVGEMLLKNYKIHDWYGCEGMTDKEQIMQLYKEMYTAMINKDKAELEYIHDDSFVLVHMTGMRQPKEVYINSIMDGTLNYYSASHEDMQVELNGDTAVLTGKSRVNAAVFGGGKHTWRLQLRFQLAKKNDEWKFTLASASTY